MTFVNIFVEIEGLEPSLTEPESVVLPLHHISIWLPFFNWDCKGMNVLRICKNILPFSAIFLENLYVLPVFYYLNRLWVAQISGFLVKLDEYS